MAQKSDEVRTSSRCGCSLDLLVNENEKEDAREGHRPPEKRKRRNLHVLVFLDVVMSMCCRGASYLCKVTEKNHPVANFRQKNT